MKNFLIFLMVCAPFGSLFGQKIKPLQKRVFQFSIAPSLGTNGLQPGSFDNYISINLTSGYSSSSLFFEIATLSNLNTHNTKGLQIAGVVNITGGNAFARFNEKEIEEEILSGYSPDLTGSQFSGLSNIVVGNVFGSQITGGFNLNKGALIGVQVGGLCNIVYKYTFGLQLAGVFNISHQAMDGVQISLISNYTNGNMAGIQIAAINQAGDIFGINSNDDAQPSGVQIGLINIAKGMGGYQIGLINIAGRSRGTQIGLINLYKGGKQSETKDGTAIGLINLGDLTYFSAYSNELYALNYKVSTGNRKNGRILRDKTNKYITNSLSYSHRAFSGDHKSLGYGIEKMYFNRSALPLQTESKFISYGLDVQAIKLSNKNFFEDINLLTKLKLTAGKRIAPKLVGFNWFIEASINGFFTRDSTSIKPDFLSQTENLNDLKIEYWPGLAVGLLLH